VRIAALGDLAEVVTALLPCQWGYSEIGQLLAERGKPTTAPFYCHWIEMYASPEFAALAEWLRELLDSLEGTVSERRLQEIFSTSARYEYLFWDMAYRLEEWPI
jgi:thiaminase/transcriptional activator TenA